MIKKDEYEYYLNQIRKEYDRLDEICGVNTNIVRLEISSRLSRKLGYFKVKRVGGFEVFGMNFGKSELSITFSDRIFDMPGKVFTEVIRHEYAHAAAFLKYPGEKLGHGPRWKEICRQVGCEARTHIDTDSVAPALRRPVKYTLRCKNCGAYSNYTRMCKTIKIATGQVPGKVWCTKCGGTEFEVKEV